MMRILLITVLFSLASFSLQAKALKVIYAGRYRSYDAMFLSQTAQKLFLEGLVGSPWPVASTPLLMYQNL